VWKVADELRDESRRETGLTLMMFDCEPLVLRHVPGRPHENERWYSKTASSPWRPGVPEALGHQDDDAIDGQDSDKDPDADDGSIDEP